MFIFMIYYDWSVERLFVTYVVVKMYILLCQYIQHLINILDVTHIEVMLWFSFNL